MTETQLSRDALVARAWSAHHARDWASAIAQWRALALASADDPVPGWALGLALRDSGDLAGAQVALDEALRRFPDDPQTALQHAWAAHQRADWPEAVRRWGWIREHHPQEATGYWAGAQALRHAGLAGGATLLEEAVRRFPQDIWSRFGLLEETLAAAEPRAAYACWTAMRPVLPAEMTQHLRMMSVRVLRLQSEAMPIRDILTLLLTESPEASEGVPFAWHFALELHKRVQQAPRGDAFAVAVREQVRLILAEDGALLPYPVFAAALFHLPIDPPALVAEARALLRCGRGWMLGALMETNEHPGRLLASALAHEAAIAPDWLAPAGRLTLLRIAASVSPAGFDVLLAELRKNDAPGVADETSAEGLLAAVVRRFPTRAEMPAPATIVIRDRALRVAVCVSGQLRGFRRGHATWGALGLAGHEVVTVVHSWQRAGRRQLDAPDFLRGRLLPPPLHAAYQSAWNEQGGLAGIHRRYPRFYGLFNDASDVTAAELRELYQTEAVVLEDDQAPPFRDYSNQQKMFYKIAAAQALADAMPGGFDLCLRLRPDKEIAPAGPIDWHRIYMDSVRQRLIYNDFGLNFVISGFGAGDQFAAGQTELMREYASLWKDYEQDEAYYERPTGITGHASLAHHLFRRGLRLQPMQGLRFGSLFDAAPIEPAVIEAALRADIGTAPRDAVDAQFLRACAEVNGG